MINDQISHLPLADGDILKLPRGTDESEMRQIADAITQLHPDKKILLLACDISDEYTSVGKPYWQRAGVAGRIELVIAPAVETLDARLAAGDFSRVWYNWDCC